MIRGFLDRKLLAKPDEESGVFGMGCEVSPFVWTALVVV
jgi:hypothetical protein|tara:strand:- start:235 stop:351 length:117 start_codon:yes stop_codon:yes gene_type:complete